MHEMGIALQVIEICQASIPADAGDARIQRINLKIGKLSAVVEDSLRFCFEAAAKDTCMEGAELHIEEVPVVVHCRDCGADSVIDTAAFSCPACGGGKLDMLSGRELDIQSIEIEDREATS